MAEYDHHRRLLCFFIVVVMYTPIASSSRTLQSKTTTTLDVKSSLQQALNTLSRKPNKANTVSSFANQQTIITSPSHTLTLPLHTRTSLPHYHSHHPTYGSLTHSRLVRDTLHVNSIYSKLNLAAVTPPLPQNNTASHVSGPLISGVSQGSGEYFTRIGIGQPTTHLYLVIDTGSDVSWIQCTPCTDCYTQSDPIYTPSTSVTYTPLPCSSPQCNSLDVHECRPPSTTTNTTTNTTTRCIYEVSYGDGSYTLGDFATETITLGPTLLHNVAIGCGHDNQGLFVGAAGILGLGGGILSFPAQINASSFSYCLVDRDSDSSSTLDFHFIHNNNTTPPPSLNSPSTTTTTAKLLHNTHQLTTFYYIDLTSLSVGGEILNLPSTSFTIDSDSGTGGVILDSGTAVTRLTTEAYEGLRNAFIRGTRHLPMTDGGEEVAGLFDTCYDLTGLSSVDVPSVGFRFGSDGNELNLPAKNYLIPVNGDGIFCLAFAPTSVGSPSIIGNVQQQGTRVSFDLDNSIVRFDASKC